MSVQTLKDYSTLFVNIPDSRLSEGVVFSVTHQRYYWIDVFKGIIFSAKEDLTDLKHITVTQKFGSFSERVGCVIPSKEDADVVYFGGKYGLAKANIDTSNWEYICLYSASSLNRDWDRMRSNDGNSDPNDSSVIYIGIMNDFSVGEVTLEGAVMKFTIGQSITCECVYDGIRIPNSINFIGKEQIYLTDSLNFQILEIPYGSKDWKRDAVMKIDIKAGNKEFEYPEPDGSFIFDNRYFVTAVWSTSKIQIYDLFDSKLLYEYIISGAERISCCCLAAKDNKVIVSTAALDFDSTEKSDNDLNGALFEIQLQDLVPSPESFLKDGKTHI
ncbi:hypothetical protein QEN19_001029 [Hanseniaspora menglaensis]